jgi:tRNA(adenine34) deaminase
MQINHEYFMAIAVEEARLGAAAGEQPFGAVVALDGQVIARAHSLKVSTSDTTAHSELLAIRAATQKLQQRSLPRGCVFYCTCEPCPMCLGAILNGGIETLVIGTRKRDVQKYSTVAFHFNDFTVERFAKMVGWSLNVHDGILKDECVALYRDATIALSR